MFLIMYGGIYGYGNLLSRVVDKLLSCKCMRRLQSHAHDTSHDVNNRAERTTVTRVRANNCDCYKTDALLSENVILQFAMKGIVVIHEASLFIDCFDQFIADLSLIID